MSSLELNSTFQVQTYLKELKQSLLRLRREEEHLYLSVGFEEQIKILKIKIFFLDSQEIFVRYSKAMLDFLMQRKPSETSVFQKLQKEKAEIFQLEKNSDLDPIEKIIDVIKVFCFLECYIESNEHFPNSQIVKKELTDQKNEGRNFLKGFIESLGELKKAKKSADINNPKFEENERQILKIKIFLLDSQEIFVGYSKEMLDFLMQRKPFEIFVFQKLRKEKAQIFGSDIKSTIEFFQEMQKVIEPFNFLECYMTTCYRKSDKNYQSIKEKLSAQKNKMALFFKSFKSEGQGAQSTPKPARQELISPVFAINEILNLIEFHVFTLNGGGTKIMTQYGFPKAVSHTSSRIYSYLIEQKKTNFNGSSKEQRVKTILNEVKNKIPKDKLQKSFFREDNTAQLYEKIIKFCENMSK